jgi:hypothetical protein
VIQRIELLADEFAARVPELQLSPAAILLFLLEHRGSPREAIDHVEQLVSKSIEAKLKRSISEAKPQDAQPESARDSMLVYLLREVNQNLANKLFRWGEESSATVPIKMVQTALALPSTPLSSPNLSPSKSDFEVVSSPFVDFHASPHASKCNCCHMTPGDRSEVASTDAVDKQLGRQVQGGGSGGGCWDG